MISEQALPDGRITSATEINLQVLFQCISDTVSSIDAELKAIANKGVFFAPELYLAFEIGKRIKGNESRIFRGPSEWIRETNFGCGGPTDIAFRTYGDTYLYLELKVKSKGEAYQADIEKLQRLTSPKSIRLFCALSDSFSSEDDGRLDTFEAANAGKLSLVGHSAFPTEDDSYKKQIFCHLRLYQVLI